MGLLVTDVHVAAVVVTTVLLAMVAASSNAGAVHTSFCSSLLLALFVTHGVLLFYWIDVLSILFIGSLLLALISFRSCFAAT